MQLIQKKRTKPKRRRRLIVLMAVALLAAYICAACLPYRAQPEPSEKTVRAFSVEDFYGQASDDLPKTDAHIPAGNEEAPAGNVRASVGNETLPANHALIPADNEESTPDRARILADNGEALAERVRLISHARERIALSTFDFRTDNSGKIMLAALMEAAGRGVEVCVLIDGFSFFAHGLGDPYFAAFAQTDNVTLKIYNPVNLLKPHKLMGRLHDKYLIADDTAYILGGRNTFDYFLGDDTDYINYDWDVLVTSGGEASSLQQVAAYFETIWALPDCREGGASVPFWKKNQVSRSLDELGALAQELHTTHADWFEEVDYEAQTVPADKITLISNPIHTGVKEPVVFYQITELMRQAGGEVFFHTPYILCSDWMQERLSEVCTKDEPVHMMTNSVANNGNPFGATDYYLHRDELLSTGVQILEYDSGVSYHGKCFTIGDRISGVGSFNWDMRSAYLDTELMLVIDSAELNAQLRSHMERYEREALRIVTLTEDPDTADNRAVSQTVTDNRTDSQDVSDSRTDSQNVSDTHTPMSNRTEGTGHQSAASTWTYEYPAGHTPRELTTARRISIRLLGIFNKAFRFLL